MSQPTARPWLIAESKWPTVRATAYDVVVLPWAATEAHGTHLPYATDHVETESLAAAAAQIAWGEGAKVAVLPGIPFGVQTGMLDLPFCINLMPSTHLAILNDVLHSLASSGVRKFLILNGHGGNDFRQILRELSTRFPQLFLATLNWYDTHNGDGIIDISGDHADERETALMLHLTPHLVAPKSEWGEGKTNPWRAESFRKRIAWAPREWTKATIDTGDGDPRAATVEKGKAYFEVLSRKIADCFVDLARADLNDLYVR